MTRQKLANRNRLAIELFRFDWSEPVVVACWNADFEDWFNGVEIVESCENLPCTLTLMWKSAIGFRESDGRVPCLDRTISP